MFRNIVKRCMKLVIICMMIIGVLPAAAVPVHADDLDLGISGLSVSYDAGTWTASGKSLSGSATGKAAGTCDSASSLTSTLTFKNARASAAQLSFDYAKPVLAAGGSVTIDGTAVTAAGSFVKEVPANGTVTVVIYSGNAGANTSSVNLTNISLITSGSVTTTFEMPQGSGTYTVDGNAITASTQITRNSTEAYTLTAQPASGYKLEGWYSATKDAFLSTDTVWKAYFDTPQTIYPVFIPSDCPVWDVFGKWFTDLNEAIAYANTSKTEKITLVVNGTLSAGTYTIPSGKSVLIPYDNASTLIKESPVLVTSTVPTVPSAYRTLTLGSGAEIIVNGNLSVGGRQNSHNNGYTGANTGFFGWISMKQGSSITLNSGSNLYCWGYITGAGTVTANAGSKVYEPFSICDIRGGSATSSMNNNEQKVFPVSQYYVQNIESSLTIVSGASLNVVATATVQGMTETPRITFVGSSGALFTLGSGTSFAMRYDPSADRNYYDLYGNASLNSFSMNVGISINSRNYVLPLMENTTIRFHSGTTTCNQDICLIPGFEAEIDQGAVLKIASGSSAYVYDREQWVGKKFLYPNSDFRNSYYSPTRANANKFSAAKMVDAKLDVNGTLDAAGSLYTTEGGADIVSTQGTGSVVFTNTTAASSTYQATQSGTTISYTELPVTSAVLHNGSRYAGTDEEYTITSGSAKGDVYTYDAELQKWGIYTNYTVTFDDDNGNVSTAEVISGHTVTKPEDPEKEGYYFAGWFNGDTEYDFTQPVTGDLTLKAKWEKLTYVLKEWKWSADYSAASAVFVSEQDDSLIEEIPAEITSEITEADCETDGAAVYTATVTFNGNTYTDVKEQVIPAIGHSYGMPRYTWSNDNSTVTASAVCAHDETHILSETVETASEITVEPLCETPGEQRFTAVFEHALFETQTKTIVLEALGHEWSEWTVVIEATEEASGLEERVCTRCGEKEIREIPALGHTHRMVHTEAKDPTCEEDGNSEYWTCEKCGRHYADENGDTEIEADSWIIKALGHDYGDAEYAWSDDYASVTASAVCKRDSAHVLTETVNTTSTTIPPTCEISGNTTYSAVFTNELFTPQSKVVEIPALGHKYGEPTYEWSDDNSTVTATAVCEHDASHVITETVNTTVKTTEPTCETAGSSTYTATFINKEFETQTRTIEIPALGHKYGEPTYEWSEDNSSVTAKAVCEHDSSHMITETVKTTVKTVNATCETAGSTTYTATFTNELFSEQTKTVEIPALGHKYGEPTYEWAADNSSVTAKAICEHDASHVITETVKTTVKTVDATCETAGSTTYTAAFTNELFSEQTRVVEIPALGHEYGEPVYEWAEDYSTVTAKAICKHDESHVISETVKTTVKTTEPTCETAGSKTYTAAFTNKKFYTQTKTIEIPALGHKYDEPTYEWSEDNSSVIAKAVCEHDVSHVITETVKTTVKTVDATCEETGSTTYTATFTNELFSEQTKVIEIPALGHEWQNPIWTWAEDFSKASVTFTCSHDAAHTKTIDAVITKETDAASCEEPGLVTYTAKAVLEGTEYTDIKEVYVEAVGHAWGEPVYEWSADNRSVTAAVVCKNDASHKVTETVQTTVKTVDATCEEAGSTTYTATFTNELFSEQTIVIEIPATGHKYGEPTYEWSADNSSVTAKAICEHDADHVITETVQTTVTTVDATCEIAGSTTYTATFTNELFSEQTKVVEIPALGHKYGEPTYEWAEDNSSVTAKAICEHDANHVITETVKTTVKIVDATCEIAGSTTYTATFSNALFSEQTKTVEIPALGHKYGEPTYEWAEDNSSVTAKAICEHDASHVITETVQTTSETIPATEYEDGSTTYTAVFTNELFETQTKVIVIPATGPQTIHVTGVELNKTELTLRVGNSETLIATVLPEDAEDKSVTWSSSDEAIATVDSNGKVTAVADKGIEDPSKAVITVTTNDGNYTAECIVTVEDPINAFVRRLYDLCFGRKADTGGFRTWTNALRNKEKTAAQVIIGFFESKEMTQMNLSDAEYVERCYRVMMDRASDAGGKKNWMEALDAGCTKRAVLRGFVGSAEFSKICEEYGIVRGEITVSEWRDQNLGITKFVARCYKEVLGRKAEVGGLNNWCRKILTASNKKQAAVDTATNGFFHSPEYLNKKTLNEQYVTTLYKTFLGREPDPSGYRNWLNKLKAGASRDSVMLGFSNSTEFAKIMESYGIR